MWGWILSHSRISLSSNMRLAAPTRPQVLAAPALTCKCCPLRPLHSQIRHEISLPEVAAPVAGVAAATAAASAAASALTAAPCQRRPVQQLGRVANLIDPQSGELARTPERRPPVDSHARPAGRPTWRPRNRLGRI